MAGLSWTTFREGVVMGIPMGFSAGRFKEDDQETGKPRTKRRFDQKKTNPDDSYRLTDVRGIRARSEKYEDDFDDQVDFDDEDEVKDLDEDLDEDLDDFDDFDDIDFDDDEDN